MLRLSKTTCLGFLIGYLCFFMALLPGRVSGALLISKPSPTLSSSPDNVWTIAVDRLIELGLSREEARRRVALLQKTGIPFNQRLIFAGGEPPQDYDPPANNIGLVILFLGIAVGIGLYAGAQTNK